MPARDGQITQAGRVTILKRQEMFLDQDLYFVSATGFVEIEDVNMDSDSILCEEDAALGKKAKSECHDADMDVNTSELSYTSDSGSIATVIPKKLKRTSRGIRKPRRKGKKLAKKLPKIDLEVFNGRKGCPKAPAKYRNFITTPITDIRAKLLMQFPEGGEYWNMQTEDPSLIDSYRFNLGVLSKAGAMFKLEDSGIWFISPSDGACGWKALAHMAHKDFSEPMACQESFTMQSIYHT